ncbi:MULTISPECIES: Na+/H+ antiporter subunit E [Aquincola]|uniref:Na+/H+ antiporter subunit E n=1 Tax=Aquincola TaxID=391952 RepID=UPI000614CF6D|nr:MULTISPECIES: Na+/H+ antiporter subunit E [Aquincola]MCR5863820.1 Na+/H+ antiporter subunit E [Aquincola sp. J276]
MNKPWVSGTAPARRWLAHPVLSLLLAGVWLLLQGGVTVAGVLWAALFGVLLPWLAAPFLSHGTRLHAWQRAFRLTGVVLWDIVLANLTVAWIAVNPASRPQPAWLRVPLDIRHPTGTVLLAAIITTTPGTVSCVIEGEGGREDDDGTRRAILVHALDCADADAMVADIKARYEAPLKEIFE